MATKQVQTTCAYCGAGCQIMFTVDTDKNKIVNAVPAKGRTNDGTLCLKGHYGWDFINAKSTQCFKHIFIMRKEKFRLQSLQQKAP